MTPRTWWASFFAQPAVVPRRTRLAATIALETLPDRDSPSSIDAGGIESPASPPATAVRPASAQSDHTAPSAGRVTLPPPVPLSAESTSIAPPRSELLAGTTWFVELDGSLDAFFQPETPTTSPTVPPVNGVVTLTEQVALPPTHGTPVETSTSRPPTADAPAPVSSGVSVAAWPPVVVIVRTFQGAPATPVPLIGRLTPGVAGLPPPDTANVQGDRGSAASPANVSVVPVSPAPGQRLTPDSPVFRISGPTAPAEPLTVSFTLAAHTAGGTTSFGGTVTLRGDSPQAAVTPRPVFVGGSPDILTVVLDEAPGGKPTGRSATLFVLPAQQVADPVLVEAHREGRSSEAFGILTQRYGSTVTRTAQRIVGNRTDAEDVSQFVFMELAKTRAKFPGTLTGWLRAVSRNAALAFLRAKRRRLRHEQNGAKAEAVEQAPPAAVDESLMVALGQLPPDLSQAVLLRYVDGFTQQEAAAIVGVPRGTLSRRAAAGVSLLREMLEWEPDCEQPGGEWHSG